MKITRKQLRKMILHESKLYENKILEMIKTGQFDIVVQAIELAELIGLVDVKEEKDVWDGSRWYSFYTLTDSFYVELALLQAKFNSHKTGMIISCYGISMDKENAGYCSIRIW